MRAAGFLDIARQSGVTSARPFRQSAWRHRVFRDDPGPLCAGLVSVWMQARLDGQAIFAFPERGERQALARIVNEQVRSACPTYLDPDALGPRDRQLLKLCFGSDDLVAIRLDAARAHSGSLVLSNLARRFRCRSTRVSQHPLPGPLPAFEDAPSSCATLFVFPTGRPRGGHRCGYVRHEMVHRFFDPNAGEVAVRSAARFSTWLKTYVAAVTAGRVKAQGDRPILHLNHLEGIEAVAGAGSAESAGGQANRTASARAAKE